MTRTHSESVNTSEGDRYLISDTEDMLGGEVLSPGEIVAEAVVYGLGTDRWLERPPGKRQWKFVPRAS